MRRGMLTGLLVVLALWPTAGRADDGAPPDPVGVDASDPSTTTVPDEPTTTTAPGPDGDGDPGAEDPVDDGTVAEDGSDDSADDDGDGEGEGDAGVEGEGADGVDDGVEATATPEGGPRTLTVTPRSGLVHDQQVVIRGRGWVPRSSTGWAQCISGAPGTEGCGPVRIDPADAAGNFRAVARVQVILETSIGTFDCRVDTCVIGANDTPSATGARFVELGFDPAGPDPVRRTATVTPDTGLVDGQEVTVTGDGFEVVEPGFGGYAQTRQCVLVAGLAQCDEGTDEFHQTDLGGHLDDVRTLDALLYLPGGATHDCRTGDCVLQVRDGNESSAEAALVPLAFDPGAPLRPAPTLVADPATGLVDGDRIGLTGEHWVPRDFLYLAFCRAGATDFYEDCSYDGFDQARADAAGELDADLAARTILRLGDGTELDCRVDACAVRVGPSETLRRSAEALLAFDPAGGILDLQIEVRPTTGLRDGDTVTVTGTGGRSRDGVFGLQCPASAQGYFDCDDSTYTWIPVDRSPRGSQPVGEPFRARMVVKRELRLPGGRTFDCAHSPCALVVATDPNFVSADRVALDFVAGSPGSGGTGVVNGSPTFAG